MNNKHSFIYNENPTLGRLLMVEGENNTTEIYRIKDGKNVIYTLNANWWDLDGIKREMKKHKKAIEKALHTYKINGIYGKVDAIAEDYETFDRDGKQLIEKLLREKLKLKC